MLEGVLGPGGTATGAAIDGYELGGKTGTAEKPDENGGYSKTKFVASFVGFAPAKRPEAARRGDGRRAAGRHLRRHGRRPGVQADHRVRAHEPADRALIARAEHSSGSAGSRRASRVAATVSALHGWVTMSATTTPTRKSSVRLAVAVVTGSGERLTAARSPAFTAWLASAVAPAPTAASASCEPVGLVVHEHADDRGDRRADRGVDRVPDVVDVRDLVRDEFDGVERRRRRRSPTSPRARRAPRRARAGRRCRAAGRSRRR